jgi:hypothetical protein
MRDEAVDIVQIQGDRVYHLNGAVGLLIYDIADASHPRLVGRHSIVGWPMGVVVRGSIATILMRWADVRSSGASSPGPALVRAVDVREPSHPVVVGESAIDGELRDARATADSMYVLSESGTARGARVVVTSLRLDGSNASAVHTLSRLGTSGWMRFVGGRLILAHGQTNRSGTRVEVLTESGTGELLRHGSLDLAPTIGRADRDTSARIDAPDAAHVRILACRAAECTDNDTLEITTIDALDMDRPRITSLDRVPSPGRGLLTRFDGERLYLSRRGWLSLGSPSTPISFVGLDGSWQARGGEPMVEGVVWNLLPVASRLLAVATRGDTEATREQLVIAAIDVRGDGTSSAPAEAALGSGWTSSAAQVNSRAMTACGGSLAVPFRTWEGSPVTVRSRIALFDWRGHGLTSAGDLPVEGIIDRLVCAGGRLLALTDAGLGSLDLGRGTPSRVSRTEPSAPSVFIFGR